ncbi:hypothetical protein L914_12729, partial [Phytophthora nicotianae]
FNRKYLKEQVVKVDLLTARYGDTVVSRKIMEAKNHPDTKALADELQAELFLGWLASE